MHMNKSKLHLNMSEDLRITTHVSNTAKMKRIMKKRPLDVNTAIWSISPSTSGVTSTRSEGRKTMNKYKTLYTMVMQQYTVKLKRHDSDLTKTIFCLK